jgi:hypothetical protein
MSDKLETHDAPPDYAPDIESTGVSGKNIASKRDADALASAIAAFTEAQEHLSGASSMLAAATHDLAHHLAVEATGGLGGSRCFPDDIRLRGMVAEARIDREFLEEIIARLAEARTALNMAAHGGSVDGWGVYCWIGNAYYMRDSDGTPTFILYIQDYRHIIDFFDVHDACDKGNCGFFEKRFGDFTVLFYTDYLRLSHDFPTAMEVGSVHSHGSVHPPNGGLYIDFAPGLMLAKEPFRNIFGTLPPIWLRTISATLSLKLHLGDARLQQQENTNE